jgi:hypothetical protein
MEIILKNIYVSERLSRETMAFQATLYINGYKVGVISNEGQGGPILYHPLEDKGNFLIREAEAWCRKLPPVIFPDTMIDGKPMSIPMELEIYLDNTITAWLEQKDREKFRWKMEKKMASAILFGIPEKTFRVLRFKTPIASMIKCNTGVERLRRDIHKWVLPLLAENEKILNTNIPARIIKMMEVGDGKWVEHGMR